MPPATRTTKPCSPPSRNSNNAGNCVFAHSASFCLYAKKSRTAPIHCAQSARILPLSKRTPASPPHLTNPPCPTAAAHLFSFCSLSSSFGFGATSPVSLGASRVSPAASPHSLAPPAARSAPFSPSCTAIRSQRGTSTTCCLSSPCYSAPSLSSLGEKAPSIAPSLPCRL